MTTMIDSWGFSAGRSPRRTRRRRRSCPGDAVVVRLAGGAGLAGDRVAGDAPRLPVPSGSHHVLQHAVHLCRGLGDTTRRCSAGGLSCRAPAPSMVAATSRGATYMPPLAISCRPRASASRSPRCPARSGWCRSRCPTSPSGRASDPADSFGKLERRLVTEAEPAEVLRRCGPCPSIWAIMIVPMFDDLVRMSVTDQLLDGVRVVVGEEVVATPAAGRAREHACRGSRGPPRARPTR